MSDRQLRLTVVLGALNKAKGEFLNYQGGTKRVIDSMRATQAESKRLKKQLADTDAYDALQKEIVETGLQLTATRRRMQDLAAQAARSDAPNARLARSLAAARKEAALLEERQLQLGRKAVWTGTTLKAEGVNVDDLARAQGRLRERLRSTTGELERQRAALKRVNDARSAMEEKQTKAGQIAATGAGTLAAGTAAAAPFVAANRRGANLEAQATTIGARANYSRAQMAALRQEIVATGKAANRTDEEVLAGLDAYSAAGRDPLEAVRAMRGAVGKAATAYKTDDAQLVGMANGARTAYGISDERAVEMAAFAGNAGQFEMSDTAAFAPQVNATYAGLGQKGERAFADVQAALQLIRRDTADSSAAATNLDNALLKIGSPATQRAFDKIGVNFRKEMDAMTKAGKSPIEAIATLTDRALKANKSLTLGDLFEDAQAQAGVRSLIKYRDEFGKLRDATMASKGQVDRDYTRRLGDQLEKEKAAMIAASELGQRVNDTVAPAFGKAADAVRDTATAVNDWAVANPQAANGLILVLAGLAGLLVVAGGVALAFAAVLAPFAALQFAWVTAAPLLLALKVSLFAAAGAAWTAAAGFIAATWPILLIVAAIAAVIAIGYLLVKNWSTIGPKIQAFFQPLLDWFASLPEKFKGFGRMIMEGLLAGIRFMLSPMTALMGLVGKLLPEKLKKQLGIKSPSRAFAELGRYTMEGLEQGVQDGAPRAAGAVAAAGDGMAAAFAPAPGGSGPWSVAGGGGSPAGGMGDLIIQSLVVYGGASQADFEKMFRDAFAKVQREQAAKRGASFADSGA